MEKVMINKTAYGGWANCACLVNGIVDLIVTADVGPRIIRYGFIGQENEMCEVASTMGLTGGDEWRIYGGHRLWHSPEDKQRTYEPDNTPVMWKEIRDGIKTMQEMERGTGIKKEMEITLSDNTSKVWILHRLTNSGLWPVRLSAWSITAMAPGGKQIIPLSGEDTGLLPNQCIVLWPYTKLNDPRICFGANYIILEQDAGIKHPFKIGLSSTTGRAVYFNHNHLFVKRYSHTKNVRYPDFGASYETYASDLMLEMETLSPLTVLEPGTSIEHGESRELINNVPMPSNDEAEIDRVLKEKGII